MAGHGDKSSAMPFQITNLLYHSYAIMMDASAESFRRVCPASHLIDSGFSKQQCGNANAAMLMRQC
jgi:hypothetical protein